MRDEPSNDEGTDAADRLEICQLCDERLTKCRRCSTGHAREPPSVRSSC